MLVSTTIVYATNEDETLYEDESYIVTIDAETGEITKEEYTENLARSNYNKTEPFIPKNVMNNSKAIVGGSDGRVAVSNTKVFPYSSVCTLEVKFEEGYVYTTAFMIYKNLALTAAHNVYNSEYGVVQSAKIYPGITTTEIPFGAANAKSYSMDKKWIENYNSLEDWCLIELDSNIGEKCGWQGIAYSDDYGYFAQGEKVTVIGYPQRFKQFTMRDSVVKATYMYLLYAVDTSKGQSGSPVRDDPGYAIGIHSGYVELNGVTYNRCANITKTRFNAFVSRMN